jgi:transglutaminase-like putative cysteine protease
MSCYTAPDFNTKDKNIMLRMTLITMLWFAAIAQSSSNTVSGTITVDIDLSQQPQGEEVQLWLPYPISDSSQDITDIALEGNYLESAVYTDKKFQTPMLYAKWNASAKNRNLTFSFKAKRTEIVRTKLPASESPWSTADHALYLRPTSNAPFTEDVQQLAEQITRGKDGVKEKARAIYDWTVDNTYRNPETLGCGSGDVCTLLKDPGGKCADISSIFIALCRASGVPAREVLGIRMGKTPIEDITTWQHCWAEFFLPGAGWVSVDPADVRKKILIDDLKLDDPDTQKCREYFFGGIDAYRVKLGQGRDILPNPEPVGGSINYLMYPFAQVGNRTLDWLDPEKFSYTIQFEAE